MDSKNNRLGSIYFKALVILIPIALSSCSPSKEETPSEPEKTSQEENSPYHPIANSFFEDDSFRVYIKTQALLPNEIEKTGEPFYRQVPVLLPGEYQRLSNGGYYATDGKQVYMDFGMTDGRHITVLDSADASTFESLGYRWAKDHQHVYHNGLILEGLNMDSLEILCPRSPREDMVFFTCVKDHKLVYYGYDLVEEAHAPSFHCISSDSSVYYEDDNWIYEEAYFANRDSTFRRKK